MASINKVTLLGRLGKDPESRTFDGGQMVCNFSLATSYHYKDKAGEKKEITEWTNVVCWGKTAEIATKYLKKGNIVHVEGRLTTRSWEKDGVTRYMTEVVVNELILLPQGSGSSSGAASSPYASQYAPGPSAQTAGQNGGQPGGQNVDPFASNTKDDLPF